MKAYQLQSNNGSEFVKWKNFIGIMDWLMRLRVINWKILRVVSWLPYIFKDNSPSNLEVIGLNTLRISTIAVDSFIDNTLAKEDITMAA